MGTCPSRPDTPLSDRGRAEAHRAATGLVELGAGRVLSSPLPRAWETARILADDLGVPLDEPYPQLREWQAPDCIVGVAPADYPPQYHRWRRIRAAEPDTALPGGESLTAFARRAIDAAELVEDIAAGAQQQLLVIAHVLLIGAVAAHTTGIREPAAVFDAATHFTLPPAGCWQHRTVLPRPGPARPRHPPRAHHHRRHHQDHRLRTRRHPPGRPRSRSPAREALHRPDAAGCRADPGRAVPRHRLHLEVLTCPDPSVGARVEVRGQGAAHARRCGAGGDPAMFIGHIDNR